MKTQQRACRGGLAAVKTQCSLRLHAQCSAHASPPPPTLDAHVQLVGVDVTLLALGEPLSTASAQAAQRTHQASRRGHLRQ